VARVIIEYDEELVIEVSLGLFFAMINNIVEYEAFLAGLRIAKDMISRMIKICTNSQLVASHVTGKYQVGEEHLQEYIQLIQNKMKEFKYAEVVLVPLEQNVRANILSKLTSTRTANGNKTVKQEVLT
jgi:ribonuclease HI